MKILDLGLVWTS